MNSGYKFIVMMGSDPQIRLHRFCRRNWENYFDLLGFEDYYFSSRTFDLRGNSISGHDVIMGWPADLRDSLLRKFSECGPEYSDWNGIFGQAMHKVAANMFRLLLDMYPEDFVLHCPTSTSAIDIEAVQNFVSLHYDGGHFYGGCPVPILNRETSRLFWFISGSGLTMSRTTVELLSSRLKYVQSMTDDLLYGILLADLPRHVFQRQSIMVDRTIKVEYETILRKLDAFRREGVFAFRFNSGNSLDLEGGRDMNDSLAQNLGMHVIFKNRSSKVQYISQKFVGFCHEYGSQINTNVLQPGSFQESGTNLIVSGF